VGAQHQSEQDQSEHSQQDDLARRGQDESGGASPGGSSEFVGLERDSRQGPPARRPAVTVAGRQLDFARRRPAA